MFDVLVHEAWISVPQKMSLHVVCVKGIDSDVQLVDYPLFIVQIQWMNPSSTQIDP